LLADSVLVADPAVVDGSDFVDVDSVLVDVSDEDAPLRESVR
jgi:hypothetical protein